MSYDGPKQLPRFACAHCCEEFSSFADEPRVWNGTPLCEDCYDQISGEDDPDFYDLPEFVPVVQSELAAALERAEKAETKVKNYASKIADLMCGKPFTYNTVPFHAQPSSREQDISAIRARLTEAEALLERMHKKYDYLMYRVGFSGDPYPIDNSIDSELDKHLREQWQLGRDYRAWKEGK